MKLHIRKTHIYVFLISFIFAILVLAIERALGIGWDYHVDAKTYANDSKFIAEGMVERSGYSKVFGNSYYFFISIFFNQSIIALTVFNLLIYSLTNALIYDYLRIRSNEFFISKANTILLLVYLFNPYRLHLATTILKETSITFLLTLLFYPSFIYFFIAILLVSLRSAGVMYIFSFLKNKNIYVLAFLIIISIFIFPELQNLLGDRMDLVNETNIRARGADTIPNWQELKYFGSFLRALIWPFLAFTGIFILISPSSLLLPLAIAPIINIVLTYKLKKNLFPFTIGTYLCLSTIAITAPGFFAFIRYSYPVISLVPLFICHDLKRRSNLKT